MSRESAREVYDRGAALRPTLYPELETESFNPLVRRLVEEAGYSLEGASRGPGLRVVDRSVETSFALLERLFLFSLWCKGVRYGGGKTSDPRLMADAVGAFLVSRATVDDMEARFPFVSFDRSARPHEAGHFQDEAWRWALERRDVVGEVLKPLLGACATRPRLRALFPFTSHETLLFSRTTGCPYDSMLACGQPAREEATNAVTEMETFTPGLYEIFIRGAEHYQPSSAASLSLGRGSAEWAATTLESHVPENWGGAVDGTRDDLASAR